MRLTASKIAEIKRQVSEWAASFEGRLPSEQVRDALDYVESNEWCIAFEDICEQLYEYSIPITEGELRQIRSMTKQFGSNLHVFALLTELVTDASKH